MERIRAIGMMMMVLVLLMIYGCSANDDQNKLDDGTCMVSISFDMDVLLSKSDDSHGCQPYDSIVAMIKRGVLRVDITGLDINSQEFCINGSKISLDGSSLVCAPIYMSIGGSEEGYIEFTRFCIYDITDGEILYSSVMSGSPGSEYIDQSKCMPLKVHLSKDDSFKRIPVDVMVFCIYSYTPEFFGYYSWSLSPVRVMKIPFIATLCDDDEGEIIACGRLQTEKGRMDGDDFISISQPFAVVDFPLTDKQTPSLCFSDDFMCDDDAEYFRFTFTMDEVVYQGIANVALLCDYENSDAWDPEFGYLRLRFCDNRNHWFFEKCGD